MDELKKDSRFSHIGKDPRFRPASKNERKLKIDRRFASMFNDPKFKLKYTVDKRGRPLIKEHTTRDDMNKFYQLEDEDDDDASSTASDEPDKKSKKKSTGDDELDELLDSDESEDDEQKDDDDEEEDEEKSSSSEEDEDVPATNDETEWNEFDEKCARSDDVSRRLAVCNMDWDRVRAVDIFLLLNSWKPADGVIKSVTIYPSEYGLQQMDLERKFGPLPGSAQPVASSEKSGTDNDRQNEAEEEPDEPEIKSDDDDDANPQNFNEDDDPDTTDPIMRERLRKYQLTRLKYYYAVVECDTVETAARIYEECDGLEYETSAVRLDLRFVPDSVTFDASIPPHDQCNQLPDKSVYKPVLFRNTALTQTKVRCTWDETPIERRRLTRKKYTMEELEKIDLDAYLASESEDELADEDDDENLVSDDEDDEKADEGVFKVPTSLPSASQKPKKDRPIACAPSVLSTQDDIDRYRAILLDFDNDSKAEKKPKKKLTNFFDERPSDEEDDDNNEFPRTADGADDDDDDDDASDIDMEITWQPGLKTKVEEKFRKPQTTTKETKKNKEKKRDTSDQINVQLDEQEDASEDHRESLALLTVDDEIDDKRDFNLRQMIKEHKQSTKAAAKKEKKSKKSVAISSAPLSTKLDDDSFHLNVDDQRFQAVYSRAAFNIDQTDPHFKATAGTQRIIDEKLKKRKLESGTPSSRTEHYDDDIVRKLKKKSAEHNQ